MNKMNFYSTIDKHIEHAENKHPHFADVIDNNSVRSSNYLGEAMRYKREIRLYKKYAIHDILLSEVYEFLAELDKCDISRAKEEACDVAAVLYRSLAWLEDSLEEEDEEDIDYREINRMCYEDSKVDEAVERDQERRAGEIE